MAVVFDAKSTAAVTGTNNTFSDAVQMTVGSGANRALLVILTTSLAPASATASWNGVSMTLLKTQHATDNSTTTFIFGLRNPASGTKTLSGTIASSQNFTFAAASYTGVEQSSDGTAFTNATGNGGAATPASVTVTSAVGSIVVAGFSTGDGAGSAGSFSATNNNTIFTGVGGAGVSGAGNYASGAATVTMTGTYSIANQNAAAGVSVNPPTDLQSFWYQPWQAPSALARMGSATYPVNAQTLLAKEDIAKVDRWYAPWREPVWSKKGLAVHEQQSLAFVKAAPFPETVTESRWHQPLSEPVRRPTAHKVSLFPFTAVKAASQGIGWFSPLSEPVRRIASPANQQVLALAPNPIVATGWSAPFSAPAQAKQRAIADYVYAPLRVSEVVTIDKWYNPLAPPTLPRKPTPDCFAFVKAAPFPESVTEDRWHQPWSGPVWRQAAQQQQFLAWSTFTPAAATTITVATTFDTEVIFPSQLIYQTKTEPFVFTVATPTGWNDPLEQPVRNWQRSTIYSAPYLAWSPTPDTLGWNDPLETPVRNWQRSPVFTAPFLAYVEAPPFPEAVTESRWHQPWSEPVRKAGLGAGSQQTLAFVAQVVTATVPFQWFTPLSDPVRNIPAAQKVNLFPFTAMANAAVAAPTMAWVQWPDFAPKAKPLVDIKPWTFIPTPAQVFFPYAPWDDFARRKPQPIDTQPLAEPVNFTVAATTIDVLLFSEVSFLKRIIYQALTQPVNFTAATVINTWTRWPDFAPKAKPVADFIPWTFIPTPAQVFFPYTPWDDFTRRKPQPLNTQPLASALKPIVEIITVDKWFSHLSLPPRAAPIAGDRYKGENDFAAIAVSMKWFSPLAMPVWQKAGLSTAAQQFLAFVKADPFPETVTGNWLASLSEPTRRIPAAQKVNLFPFTAIAASAEVITVDKWFVSFTDPVRIKPQLATGLQQSLAFVKAAPFPESVTEDRWHQPWSEPLRTKPGLSAANQPALAAWSSFTPAAAATPTMAWSNWPDFASRVRRAMDAPLVFLPLVPSATVIADWPDFVRSKPRAVDFIPWTFSLNPRQVFFPYAPWDDFTRRKPQPLDTQPLAEPISFTIEVTLVSKWFEALSLPPGPKRGLGTHLQSSYTNDTMAAAIALFARSRWYAPLSEPVRRKGIRPEFQRFLERDPFGASVYLASLNVTEQGDFLTAVLYQFNTPLLAYVDIVQNDPRHRGELGIIENVAQSSIVASIVEPQTVPATGQPVSAVAGARVAIIIQGAGP